MVVKFRINAFGKAAAPSLKRASVPNRLCYCNFMAVKTTYYLYFCIGHVLSGTAKPNSNKSHIEGLTSIQGTSVLNKDVPREECKGETVLYNVDLKGGLTANSFKRYQQVTSMESCLERCCDLNDCDVALIKENDCFAVHCSTQELCQVVDGVGKLARVSRRGSGKTLHLLCKCTKFLLSCRVQMIFAYYVYKAFLKNWFI